ncbi:metal ABC transporter substrate-binding protein [Desulforudis sp. 1088]|uniref:metal ABC transporter substrate-binding protein n=1 Tax=unclassified Candidatus Desulforudis TaxID=2635950 RepID=UPI003CE5B8FD
MLTRIRITTLVALLAVVLAAAAGCGSTEQPGPRAGTEKDKIIVAASIFPLADITKQIAGDRADVITVLPPGASPHTFEPTPDQVKRLSNASLLIQIGANLDDWAAKAVTSAAPSVTVVKVADGVKLLEPAEEEHHHEGHEGTEGQEKHEEQAEETRHHHHGGPNPHIWLDPVIARDRIVPAVTEGLCKVDPEGAEIYRQNARKYQDELTALDQEVRQQTVPLTNRSFISFHNAWTYYAARYGLKEAAVIEQFPGQEPPAKWLAEVVETARKTGAKTVFAEPQLSSKAAEVIAAEFGGKVLILDPLGDPGLPDRDGYLKLIRYNTAVLVQGLK